MANWTGMGGIGGAIGTITGGMVGSSVTTTYSSSTSGGNLVWGNYTKPKAHPPYEADSFSSLSAYIRSLLRCEPSCECKWCTATELDRQMAIAQLFKAEPEATDAK